MVLTLVSVVLAQTCGLAVASSHLDDCTTVKLANHGWVGLTQTKAQWALSPLRTVKETGETTALCVKAEPWANLALRLPKVNAQPLEVREVDVGGTCHVSAKTVALGPTSWALEPGKKGALTLRSTDVRLVFDTGSDCWTRLLFGDLDGDGEPDLITLRDGAGAVFSLFLSSQKNKERVLPCATLQVPPS